MSPRDLYRIVQNDRRRTGRTATHSYSERRRNRPFQNYSERHNTRGWECDTRNTFWSKTSSCNSARHSRPRRSLQELQENDRIGRSSRNESRVIGISDAEYEGSIQCILRSQFNGANSGTFLRKRGTIQDYFGFEFHGIQFLDFIAVRYVRYNRFENSFGMVFALMVDAYHAYSYHTIPYFW